MSREKTENPRRSRLLREQMERLRRQIADIDLVCPGSLVKRFNTCGNPACRCRQGKDHWHGPYYVWSRLEKGRLTQTVVSAEKAKDLRRAIRNYRRVLRLLGACGRKTARVILEN